MLVTQSKSMSELVKDIPTVFFARGTIVFKPSEHHRMLCIFLGLGHSSDRGVEPSPLECDSYIRLVLF